MAKLLGQGPAADLYLAEETGSPSRQKMLVKVLRVPIIQPVAKVEATLEQLVSLRHPHIHPLQGLGWTAQGGSLYLLSSYEEQGSLQYQPAERQRLPPLAVAGLVRQIAEALQYAHERQMVHGRLKPENCLMVAPATVQVCDFYHCLFAREDDAVSPYYVAPEQFLNRAEPASDQYALAVITYHLLTARLPFSETGPLGVMAQQLQRDPLPISTFRSDLPGLVDVTIGRALSKQPRDRFPSILAFAAALQNALEQHPRVTGNLNFPAFPRLEEPPQIRTYTPPAVRVQTPPPGGVAPLCLLPGHTAEATILRWAPSGIHLASAGADQSVRLWLVQKQIGTPLAVLEGHSDTVLTLSWSPDSALLVSAAADATLRIWDVSQITHGGRSVLGGVHRMEAAWWGHDGAIAALDWSPDGTRIASGGADRTIRLWDKAGRALRAWQAHGRGGVSALAWSPDGSMLASGGADHQVMLWDAANNANVLSIEAHHDEIRHLAWSADGRLIASVAGKKDLRVCLWNALNGQRVAALGGHTREVIGLLWSADATWLATASADRRLRFWSTDRTPGQQLGRPLEIENTALSMAGSPNSGLIALGLADMLILVLRLTA
ncbi:MAG TPA: serine/threonine-protein kinase [Ktedonobacterales bacterium]